MGKGYYITRIGAITIIAALIIGGCLTIKIKLKQNEIQTQQTRQNTDQKK